MEMVREHCMKRKSCTAASFFVIFFYVVVFCAYVSFPGTQEQR